MPVIVAHDRPVCLWAENISFSYSGDRVLENISLAIRQEEFVGIAGLNGAGKTTLLKVLVGLLRPDTGTVTFSCHQGDCKGRSPCRPCIGYVPQQAALRQQQFPVTVREVVAMGTYGQSGLFSRPTKNDLKAIDATIAEAGLSRISGELFSDLSGGQQQRVLIARALAGNPHILALDEPTSGIDAKSKEEFYALLSHLHSTHKLTVLLILHDLTELSRTMERIIFLHHRILFDGPAAELGADGLWNLMVQAGKG
ncbi:metal ABC transporter ATP-binding protein [Methanoregula sp.]|uniref:metal ABC transporter ATP-binding protein n=1 Tax=Methanoregula sp. TaxID=2052170 RepID=UPI002BCE87D9|nr:metal ABC transporter ATP-binding protein [Methanoregula sp.]HVP95972.1 metal ABC transporter ATP-binding protein [Methanoregula sp.]